jgi:ceramide glucosyltransferase
MIAAGVAAMLSGIGLGQAFAGYLAVLRFVRDVRPPALRDPPAITVLKPLYGDEPLLERALASLCMQDYPAPWQVVFGIGQPGDSALPVVRRLQARFPGRDLAVVVDPTAHGPNRKVGNLINLLPVAKHGVVVIADSDVHVAPDWLRRLAAALAEPGVGLVTTIYTGLPASGIGALGAMGINHYFLPGALLARVMGRQDCLGATMMLRRETLARIGGFAALVNHLADDNVLGRLVQGLGLKVALADTVPATTVAETTLRSLWRHELRWARTIRALEPLQFAASALQYPLAWAAFAVVLAGAAPWSLAWFGIAWAARALAALGVDRALGLGPDHSPGCGPDHNPGLAKRSPLWLLPVRELMSVGVMVASYAGRRVEWRGHTMQAEGFDPR